MEGEVDEESPSSVRSYQKGYESSTSPALVSSHQAGQVPPQTVARALLLIPNNDSNSIAQRGYVLSFFNLVSIATLIVAAASLLGQLFSITYKVLFLLSGNNGESSIFMYVPSMILQIYSILFSASIICIELEWTRIVYAISTWEVRGLFYLFNGILTYQEGLTNSLRLDFLIIASAWSLVFFGLVYIVMGLACLKKIRDNRMATYIKLLSHQEIEWVLREGR